MTDDTRQRISRARAVLIRSHRFYGVAACSLDYRETDQCKTMATDGECLFVNPDFAAKITDEEMRGVIAHECLHVMLKHHARRGQRDAKRWNVAADYAINTELTKDGFKLPAGGLVDPQYDGMSAEQIYDRLPEGDQGGSGGDQPGEVWDAPNADTEAGKREAEARADRMRNQAAAAARGAGKLPAHTDRWVRDMTRPPVSAYDTIRAFLEPTDKSARSMSRPNRRWISSGLYLPGAVPGEPEHAAAIVDVSGSVGEKHLARLGGILSDLVTERDISLTVLYADTEVRGRDDYEAGDSVTLRSVGGGGTRFDEPVRYVTEHLPDVDRLIYLTDLHSNHWPDASGLEILWVAVGARSNPQAPVGQVLDLDRAS